MTSGIGLGREAVVAAFDELDAAFDTVLGLSFEAITYAQRARKRHLTIARQDIDGMSRIHGLLDPEARATLDAVLAKLAAPGACNPEDPNPRVDGPPDHDSA